MIAHISNTPDVFDYETWFASQSWQVGDPINPYGNMDTTGGSEITDPAQRTEYANLNFNPYKKKLENGPVIRYLYTGREYNVETGDYYYRMRMMDSSVGRFGSKDPILYLNLYRYVKNNPMRYRDITGKSGEEPSWSEKCSEMEKKFDKLNKQLEDAKEACASSQDSEACDKADDLEADIKKLGRKYNEEKCGTMSTPQQAQTDVTIVGGFASVLIGYFNMWTGVLSAFITGAITIGMDGDYSLHRWGRDPTLPSKNFPNPCLLGP